MEISIGELAGVCLVAVSGRVDNATAPDLEAALNSLVATHKIRIVIDLKDVDFISSAGLRVMVLALKAAARAGGSLRLANPAPRVDEVLRLAGLASIFAIYASREEAIARFSAAQHIPLTSNDG